MSLCYGQNIAQKEANARIERTVEAQQLLMQGDVAYSAGKHAEAAEQFLKARNLLPAAPATMELRDAATERYATAAVQAAAQLSRKGDVEGAKQLIDQVLAEDLAPRHGAALAMRDQLNDPIRTNPALTKEHAKDIDEVRRTLYEADGFVQLGKFDMAKTMYEDVLRIDPSNKAARRGMEQVAAHQSDYAKTAYDQTRAQMLQEVDALWETPVPTFSDSVMLNPTESANQRSVRFVTEQMRSIIFPSVDLEGVGIEEAVDFIRQQSRQLDNTTTDPVAKGFNIVLSLGRPDSEIGQKVRAIRFDLKLKNVPVETLLEYICGQTRTQYSIDEFAINIRPLGTDGAELVGRTYKVPPDFLSADSVGAAAAAAPANPFDDAPEEGLSAKRMTALEKLRSYGVSFPEGAKASYNAVNSSLFVLNTALNHDLIQQVVDTMAQTEPVQVVIRVTMIKVLENQLNELGFDWLFGNVGLGGNGISPGNDALFLGGGTAGNGNGIDDILLSGANSNPVTAGNRSGDSAIQGNSIDAFIQRSALGFSPPPRRAPGVLTLLSNDLSGGQALMLMRGLNQKKGTDFMTCPATVTRSGQTSKIEIIQELIYPTEYEPPELPQQVGNAIGLGAGGLLAAQPANFPITPAMPTAFEKRDVGVTLEVNPIVSADRRYIELALKPEMVTFDGFVNYGTPISSGASSTPLNAVGGGGVVTNNPNAANITPNRILQPVFSVVRSDTSVTIADGATIVLGGMVEEKLQNVEDQVPILGSMPFVGRLFQSKARQPVKRNVLIMVNVELQDPSGRPYRNR